jgi:hypothetical protein
MIATGPEVNAVLQEYGLQDIVPQVTLIYHTPMPAWSQLINYLDLGGDEILKGKLMTALTND